MAHLHALPVGHEFEGYRIERVLGAGGFGITYLATEAMIGRAVAIKEYLPSSVAARATDGLTVHPLVAADADAFRWGLKRFRNEARTLVSFRHPNIVPVYRYFEGNGTAYLVMAYEAGASLAQLLKKARTLPEAEIRGFLGPLLDGVAEVHKAGFLHRDIKPANIVIRASGEPVLIDFGAARLAMGTKSQSAHAIVSPGYAPFEQYTNNREQGAYTDIYALGATLYCCVTGIRPVEATDRIAGVAMRPAGEIAKNRYSAGLLAAIDHALAIEPEDRPQNVAAWRAEIDGPSPTADPTLAPAHTAATTRAPAPPPAAPAKLTRRAVQIGLLAGIAGLVSWGGYAAVGAHVAKERAQAEEEERARAKLREDQERQQREAAAQSAKERRTGSARQRAEAAAQRGREAQAKAQAEARLALAAKRDAVAAAECGRQAAARARRSAAGHYAGKLNNGNEYEGQLKAGSNLIEGCGVITKPDRTRFEGEMYNGHLHGHAVAVTTNGVRFEGLFQKDVVNGHGVWRFADATEFQGRFSGVNVAGPAVWIEKNGRRYEGEFRSDRWSGFGTIRLANGEVYEGEFADGDRHGLGVSTDAAGAKTHGRWERGVYKGLEEAATDSSR